MARSEAHAALLKELVAERYPNAPHVRDGGPDTDIAVARRRRDLADALNDWDDWRPTRDRRPGRTRPATPEVAA